MKKPIHYASENGCIDILKFLIEEKCDIESETVNKWKPIHFACSFGYIDIVKLLVDQKCNIESEDDNNVTPIHFACSYGHIDIVELLIENQCNIECEDKDKWRPLHFACWKGHVDIVKFLIDKECNIESEDDNNRRPIHIACENSQTDIVKLLIDKKCDIECEDKNKKRPLHFACEINNVDIVESLLQHKCQIDAKTEQGLTPLNIAQLNGDENIVKLIEGIKNPEKISETIINNDDKSFASYYTSGAFLITDGMSEPFWLEMILDKKADKISKYILDKPIDSSRMENYPETRNTQLWQEVLLYQSIRDHDEEGFRLICCAKVINTKRKIIPCSFLEVAAENGSYVLVEEILRKSIFDKETWERAKKIALEKGHQHIWDSISYRESLLHCRDIAKLSLLHTAVSDNDPDMIKFILTNSLVDPNCNHEILGTPLALAIILCYEKCVAVLGEFNVDCNTKNKYMRSPLHEAISNGMVDHCQYVIDHLLNIDQIEYIGQTALHFAVMRGCEDLCEKLVEKGADCLRYIEFLQNAPQTDHVQLPSKRENSLTLCAKINKTIYSCFLKGLKERKEAKSSDEEGNSLLHLTVQFLNIDLCNALIEAGENVDSVNNDGDTPLFTLLTTLNQQTFDDNEKKVIEMIDLFVKYQPDINKLFQGNLNVFDVALQFNSQPLLQSLVPPLKNQLLKIDENILKIAFGKNCFTFCEALLESVSKDQLKLCIGTEIMDMAILQNQTNLLKCFLMNADDQVKQSMVERVLYRLAELGDCNSFESLLNIEIKNPACLENGETLLTSLFKENKFVFCQKILQSDANYKQYTNLKNGKNQLPLQVAIEIDLMDIVQQLIFETENLDNVDDGGYSALSQLFVKISNTDDKIRNAGYLNAIKTIILGGGNINLEISPGVKIIECCSKVEIRNEIEKVFTNNQKKTEKIVEIEKIVVVKTCCICMDREVDSVLDCGHVFCEVCGETRPCPLCKSESGPGKRIYLN